MKSIFIIGKYRRLAILLGAMVATLLLLVCVNWNHYIATKIVGVDNINVRSLYYKFQYGFDGGSCRDSTGDSIVIYQPLIDDVPDVRKKIAEELEFVSQFHPQAIIFDYVFENEYDFTKASDELLIHAIKKCMNSGIKFYIPYTNKDKVRVNFFSRYLAIKQGSVIVPEGIIGNYARIDNYSWMPELVSGNRHSNTFYKFRGIDFTKPNRIPHANHDTIYTKEKLTQLLSKRYVIFSDTRDRADLKIMPFPAKDLQINNNYYLSGAAQLWYAMRAEVYGLWDFFLPDSVALLFALIIGYFYLCVQDRICKKSPNGFVKRVFQFLSFIFTMLFIIPTFGFILMFFHIVMPLAHSAIFLVFIDILKNDISYE